MRKWWGNFTPIIKRILLAAVIVVISAVIVVSVVLWKKGAVEQEKVSKGISFLKHLEEQDVSEISANISAVEAELNLEIADTNESAVWSKFANAVILGDSRAAGFSYYEFVPEERVLAKNGGKITDIPEYVEQLKALNPKLIFLCFGLNEVGIGLWPTVEAYNAVYEEQIQLLMQELPNCTVYINSILPAVGSGLETNENYSKIGEYNQGLSSLCEEKEYHFVDNTQITKEHEDMYQEDGLHVKAEFYKYWAANMVTGVEEW